LEHTHVRFKQAIVERVEIEHRTNNHVYNTSACSVVAKGGWLLGREVHRTNNRLYNTSAFSVVAKGGGLLGREKHRTNNRLYNTSASAAFPCLL